MLHPNNTQFLWGRLPDFTYSFDEINVNEEPEVPLYSIGECVQVFCQTECLTDKCEFLSKKCGQWIRKKCPRGRRNQTTGQHFNKIFKNVNMLGIS